MTHSPLSCSFLIIITSGKKPHWFTTCWVSASNEVGLQWVCGLRTQLYTHNSRSMERHSLHHPWSKTCMPARSLGQKHSEEILHESGLSSFKQWLQNHMERGEIPSTTSPVNSQKCLMRENAFVVFERQKSLRQGSNSLLWQRREAEQLQDVPPRW